MNSWIGTNCGSSSPRVSVVGGFSATYLTPSLAQASSSSAVVWEVYWITSHPGSRSSTKFSMMRKASAATDSSKTKTVRVPSSVFSEMSSMPAPLLSFMSRW